MHALYNAYIHSSASERLFSMLFYLFRLTHSYPVTFKLISVHITALLQLVTSTSYDFFQKLMHSLGLV